MLRQPFREPNLVIPIESLFRVRGELDVVGWVGIKKVVRFHLNLLKIAAGKFQSRKANASSVTCPRAFTCRWRASSAPRDSRSIRSLHHSIIVSINGESFRLKDKRKAGLLAAPTKIVKHQN